MLRSEDIRFFSVVARETSLAAAARRLNISPSAVTQRLQALERQLGLRLTHRNGRTTILTDEGAVLAEEGTRILGELDALRDTLASRRGTVSGLLRVLAPFGFGRRHVAPLCEKFQQQHPALQIDLQLTDRLGRHPEQAWDVAIHIGELQDSALKMRRLAPNRRLLCAAPAYLETRGVPHMPSDLADHDCIVLRENDEDASLWRFSRNGETQGIRVHSHLSSNDGGVARGWALAGRGIVIRSEWDVAEDVAAGRLTQLLPDYTLPPADIILLTGSRADAAARTRAFIQFLSLELAGVNWGPCDRID